MQDGEDNVGDQVARALRSVQGAAAIDRRLEEAAEQLAQIDELVADVCRKLQSGQARLDLDPARMQAVQERLDEVHTALKRFGPTEADLRRNLAKVAAELATAEGKDSDPAALAAELQQATEAAAAVGRKLLRARHKAAGPFSKAIVADWDLETGLLSLGNDPRPLSRSYRVLNTGTTPATARLGVLCVGGRSVPNP